MVSMWVAGEVFWYDSGVPSLWHLDAEAPGREAYKPNPGLGLGARQA